MVADKNTEQERKGGIAACYYFYWFPTFLRVGIPAYEAMLEEFGFIGRNINIFRKSMMPLV